METLAAWMSDIFSMGEIIWVNLASWFSFFLRVDQYLEAIIIQHGIWVYALLFFIIFAETGLIIFPFLPGDSLLFIAGAFCAADRMHLGWLSLILFTAAIAGDGLNFAIGNFFGDKVWKMKSRFIDQKALLLTRDFYERYGGITIILARFVPIIRTFAPFIAGISRMSKVKFQIFNIAGAAIWIFGLLLAGYFLGSIPIIKANLHILALLGLSAALVPTIFGCIWKIFQKTIR